MCIFIFLMNVKEYRNDNQKRTIQRHRQHWTQYTDEHDQESQEN